MPGMGDEGDKARQGEVPEAAVSALLKELGLDRPPPRPRPKTDWTVRELYRAVLPEPIWVVPGLLPAGLASLAGRPKMGKSLLGLQLAAAVAAGRAFLGREATAGPVLYLALEDSLPRLQERLRRLHVAESAPIRFHMEWPTLDDMRGLRQLLDAVVEMRPRLVVIDTLSRALRLQAATRASMMAAVMTGLQQLAHKRNCAILTIDHHRKDGRGDDVLDDLLGPTSKAAALDTAWGLYRGREPGSTILRVTGREVAPCELPLEFDAGSGMWQLRPEPEVTPRETTMTRVLRALAELGGAATTAEIAGALGLNPGNVSRALRPLLQEGRVRRGARQGHRVPYELNPPTG